MKNKLKYFLFGFVLMKAKNKPLIDFASIRDKAKSRDTFIYGEPFLKLGYQNLFHCDQVLTDIFGADFKFTNGFVVQYNHHGINIDKNKRQPVFHIDSDYDWFRGYSFVKKYNNLAKIGVYGQSYKTHDNVLAIPFSHFIFRIPTCFLGNLIGRVALRLANFLAKYDFFKKMTRVKLEEGDVLIFDCLLMHASDDGDAIDKTVIYTEVGSKEGVRLHQIYNVYGRAVSENKVNQKDFARDPYRYTAQVKMYYDDDLSKTLCGKHFSHVSQH